MKISLRHFILFSLFLLLIILFAFISLINSKVTNKLDGVLWTVPAKVYSRQMVIAEGIEINKGMMIKELSLHSYIKKSLPNNPLIVLAYAGDSTITKSFFFVII